MNGTRGYVFSRPFMGERAPQHIQNIILRDYCQKHGLRYLLSATEYAMENCYLVLEQVLKELPQLEGIVAYSLFQLPEDTQRRILIYKKLLSEKKKFHFAVEGLKLESHEDVDRLENLWKIKLTLPDCLHFHETPWEP